MAGEIDLRAFWIDIIPEYHLLLLSHFSLSTSLFTVFSSFFQRLCYRTHGLLSHLCWRRWDRGSGSLIVCQNIAISIWQQIWYSFWIYTLFHSLRITNSISIDFNLNFKSSYNFDYDNDSNSDLLLFLTNSLSPLKSLPSCSQSVEPWILIKTNSQWEEWKLHIIE